MKRVLVGVLAILVSFLPASTVFAKLSEEQLYFYGQNGIYFYDPGAGNCNPEGGAVTGGNQNYAGAQVFSDAEIVAIEANQPIYQEAANEYNIPWQILAVLHSIETGLRRYNPDNGQGVYQLYTYTAAGTNENRFEPAASISEEEFLRQTLITARLISEKTDGLETPEEVKDFFFAYNGKASQYINKALALGFSQEEANIGEGSIYVMNRYDEQRDPMSANMNPAWPGRFTDDGVYTAGSTTSVFGAFVKYVALGGASYCASGGGTIAETAIELSWEGTYVHSKNDPKPEYVAAMKEVGAYQMGNGVYPYGASCDQFVGTVMRYSEADPDYPIFGPAVQKRYMDERPDMYMKVETGEDFSLLQPGDIFVTTNAGNHIYIYVGEIDGAMYQASASANDRTGEHFPAVYFRDSGTGRGARYYEVYRRINF